MAQHENEFPYFISRSRNVEKTRKIEFKQQKIRIQIYSKSDDAENVWNFNENSWFKISLKFNLVCNKRFRIEFFVIG